MPRHGKGSGKSGRKRRKQGRPDEPILRIPPRARREPIGEILTTWGHADWDLAIVTDGSGGGDGFALGWSAILVDRDDPAPPVEIHGAQSRGSTLLAELMPVAKALAWHHERRAARARRARTADTEALRTHVISDNVSLVVLGNALVGGWRTLEEVRNRLAWSMVLAAIPAGYRLHFHLARRASLVLNCYVDHVARDSFRCLQSLRAMRPPTSPDGRPIGPEDCQPPDFPSPRPRPARKPRRPADRDPRFP